MWLFKVSNNLIQSTRNSNVIKRFYKSFQISKEVRHALEKGAPVVALESTIITHGMPYPENIHCTLEVENIVREEAAIPATIAIINGNVTVGLNHDQISELADVNRTKPIKTSRRDFPYVTSQKLNGGTTVSGTVLIAEKVGIPIFVTGGIGGVHRDGENTLDISADLIELGRSSVAVVSSGVKSILDIPKTLEYLETLGVFVATLSDTTDFPSFFSRTSGSHAPYNVKTVRQAAEIIQHTQALDMKSGMLFAVPVPKEYSLDEAQISAIIEHAIVEAKKEGITGKYITPFLLNAVNKLTSGKSLQTNIALIKNNAKYGARIATELSRMKNNTKRITNQPEEMDSLSPVIIGGSIVDCCATVQDTNIKIDGSINYTKFAISAGGVGRNICEALGKLGTKSRLISAIGDDNHGQYLHSLLPPYSSKTVQVIPDTPSAQCTVVLDANGECKMLLGQMDIHRKIVPESITNEEELLQRSPLIVADGNLPLDTLSYVLKIAEKYGKPVFYEPTDVPVAANPFRCPHSKSLKFISPNINELINIAETLGYSPRKTCTNIVSEAAELGRFVSKHVDTLIITLGSEGIMIVRKNTATSPLLTQNNSKLHVRYYKTSKIEQIVNVSGAGDCLAAGIITAMLFNYPENTCVSVGFAAAEMALQSSSAVPMSLFDRNHPSWLQHAKYIDL